MLHNNRLLTDKCIDNGISNLVHQNGRSIYILKIAELDCFQIIILSIYVPSTHA